jgi:penicillin-binding protein 1A
MSKKQGAGKQPARGGCASFVARFFIGSAALGLTAAVIGGYMGMRAYESLCPSPCIDLSPLRDFRPDEGSVILDRNGNEVAMLYLAHRRMIALEQMPEHLRQAFIAVEDQRFHRHTGVDYRRVFGAIAANVAERRVSEGFSTITMQLARNVFPEQLPYRQRTIKRKLTEVRVARDVENAFSKDDILGFYLNTIYLGAGAHGVEAAARAYFGKAAAELTIAESALLAGLPQAPSRYDPYRNMDAAMRRRAIVLGLMHSTGAIDAGQLEKARGEPITLAFENLETARAAISGAAPYFVEEVRRDLERRFGRELYRGGLRIHTTLDLSVQQAAETSLETMLRRVEASEFGAYRAAVRDTLRDPGNGDGPAPAYIQGAVVVMEAATGDVLAMVGGRDFRESRFNRATQALRQPGSSFKPFVYVAAIEAGASPADMVSDGPVAVPDGTGRMWEPKNFSEDSTGTGWMDVRTALVRSRNRAAVRVSQVAGVDSVIGAARRMGIATQIPEYPSVVLGSIDVRVLEMIAAYTPLAREDGYHTTPRMVPRVEDRDGRLLMTRAPQPEPAIDPETAYLVRNMLRGVVEGGTGTAVRTSGYRGPAAGKTGTTNNSTDA